MNKLSIKRATQADIGELATMQVLAWISDLNIQSDFHLQNLFVEELIKRWSKHLENNIHVLLLLENDKIIGFSSYAIYIPQNGPYSAPDIEILNLYINPTLRRMGFGKLLYEALISEIHQIHPNKMHVWVLEEDIQTKSFYEKFGFYSTFNTRFATSETEIKEVQYQFTFSS